MWICECGYTTDDVKKAIRHALEHVGESLKFHNVVVADGVVYIDGKRQLKYEPFRGTIYEVKMHTSKRNLDVKGLGGKKKMKDTIIISPHPDDFLIGCYELVEKYPVKNILFLSKYNKQADTAAEYFGTVPIFTFSQFLQRFLYELNPEIIFSPSLKDQPLHPLHREATWLVKLWAKDRNVLVVEYTIHKVGELFLVENWKKKRELLDCFFPTEKSLWENEWKYFLYEGWSITIDTRNISLILGDGKRKEQIMDIYNLPYFERAMKKIKND